MRIVLIALVFCITACASIPVDDTRPVLDAMDRFMIALNALDADDINASLADDVIAFFPTVKPERVEGKEAVAAVFREFVEQSKTSSARKAIVPQDLTISRSGNLAVVTFQVPNPAVVSRRTFVFQRNGDRWLITHLHASNIRLAD